MKKMIVSTIAVLACAVAFALPPTVSSYVVPTLVDQINTGLATLSALSYTNSASGIVVGNLPAAQITNAFDTTAFTFTKAITAAGDIKANEIDAETATALLVGKATATTVTLGAADTGATVPGTLGVTGVATFTVAPKMTVVTAPSTQTLTATNGPTVVSNDSPIWLNVTIGSTTYVVPAYAIP